MSALSLKPTHKAVTGYYDALRRFERLGVKHEGAVRSAFQVLLDDCARQLGRKLVPEYPYHRHGQRPIRVDGAIVDQFNLAHGLWEAKDTADDLEKEVRTKFALGYPRNNILFQSPDRAILFQNGKRVLDTGLGQPELLIDTLRGFLEYQEPALEEWDKASIEFKERIAEHGRALTEIIERERQQNVRFTTAFSEFVSLCRASLNPNLSDAAVEEMLIQHILTWRIFKNVFDVGDFMQRNIIAAEIEKVVQALTSRAFSREDFLTTLDRFYIALEHAAATITDFSEKQKFLNTVYERFFQGFAVKQADSLGIVYTPQPIVDFMIASVEQLLESKFKRSLAHKNVQVLDGFTGTGNFIVNIMRSIPRGALVHKYAQELHCNEVLLLPYYVASMNIEHAYWEATGQYQPFEGICLVDTFETAEKQQSEFTLFNERNAERVQRQRRAPIFVCIGNPPYNAGQQDENDNNKNRKYAEVDRRVAETYGADSTATLKNSLADPYVKAIRWASDRIGEEGIVAFVTNNGFIDGIAADGMRKQLEEDFDLIYLLDLGGNVRKNPKLSGTTHNVFGIQVGVSINFFARLPKKDASAKRKAKIFYHAVPTDWRKIQKYEFLEQKGDLELVKWGKPLQPDKRHNWLTRGLSEAFERFIPLGSKEAKQSAGVPTVFRTYCNGVKTNSDAYLYSFDRKQLTARAKVMVEAYEVELNRWRRRGCPKSLDGLLKVDEAVLKWVRHTKKTLLRGKDVGFSAQAIRTGLYRPFCTQFYYFEPTFNEDLYQWPEFLPNEETEEENRILCVTQTQEKPFVALVTNRLPNLVMAGGFGAQTQSFPFYIYEEGGTKRRENIPLSSLIRFQTHYGDDRITKWDIFYYVCALLQHPGYRQRFAANLKRELPRIPFAAEFHAFAKAGKKLAELHVDYKNAKEYALRRVENKGVPMSWRVEKMKLSSDKRAIIYNESLTLQGVPPEVYDYKLGNRSALEWIIDQYQMSVDPRSGLINDPNQPEDEKFILRLICRVITVSLDTMNVVHSLPADFGAGREVSTQQGIPRMEAESAYYELRGRAAAVGADPTQRSIPLLERYGIERDILLAWAQENGLVIAGKDYRSHFRERGAEHDVFFDKEKQRYFKITRGHEEPFGFALTVDTVSRIGKKSQGFFDVPRVREATPIEYLARIVLFNRTFDDAIEFEGVIGDAGEEAIVISQPFVRGHDATDAEVSTYMQERDFVVVEGVTAGRRDSVSFYRAIDHVAVFDTHGENFLTDGTVVAPVDALIVAADEYLCSYLELPASERLAEIGN